MLQTRDTSSPPAIEVVTILSVEQLDKVGGGAIVVAALVGTFPLDAPPRYVEYPTGKVVENTGPPERGGVGI